MVDVVVVLKVAVRVQLIVPDGYQDADTLVDYP